MEPDSSSDSQPVFPPEVFDLILSNLSPSLYDSEDSQEIKEYLSSCALVCRVWRELARTYQFESFHCDFDTDEDPEEVPEFYRPPRKLSTVLDFLRSQPSVCRVVKKLSLSLSWDYDLYPDTTRGADPYNPASDPVTLAQILQLLPHLRDVVLSNISFESLPSDMPLIPVTPPLHSLAIDQRSRLIPTIQGTFNLLRLFGGAEQLSLSEMRYREQDSVEPIPPLPSQARYTSLVIEDMRYKEYLFQALNMCQNNFPLRSLMVEFVDRGDMDSLKSLLHVLCPTLRELCLYLQAPSSVWLDPPEVLEHMHSLSLSECTSLDVLSFTIDISMKDRSDDPYQNPQIPKNVLNCMAAILPTAPRNLRAIVFVVPYDFGEHYVFQSERDEWTDLADVEDLLLSRVEDGLQRIILTTVPGPPDERDAVKKTFIEALPRLSAKVTMEVDYIEVTFEIRCIG